MREALCVKRWRRSHYGRAINPVVHVCARGRCPGSAGLGAEVINMGRHDRLATSGQRQISTHQRACLRAESKKLSDASATEA